MNSSASSKVLKWREITTTTTIPVKINPMGWALRHAEPVLSAENLTCTNTFHSHTTQCRPWHLLPTLVKSFPLHQDTLLHPLNIFTAGSLSSSSHYFSVLPLGDINSYLWNHSSSLVSQSFDLFYSKDGDFSHSSPRSYLWSYHFQKVLHILDFRHHPSPNHHSYLCSLVQPVPTSNDLPVVALTTFSLSLTSFMS